ncbi:hypothetical protein [Bacillus sp. SG-1]|uniref:hypothetical protein n=1 Tax=Bacillus sp. SG-1 TaxID=161544 RepID=UPI000154512C|nr:hypothetical protein [Bacillus sp. SG-1]EDL64548.1 hypothetical protein BSG1_08416 [Bacillus sp. SG-1]
MERFIAEAEKWKTNNTLLQVRYSIPKVGPKTFSGRIVNLQIEQNDILFYDVDSKMVHNISLQAIDEIIPFAAAEVG